MTSITMFTMGMQTPAEVQESATRITDEPVRTDGEDAQQAKAPDFNEVSTDTSPELMGLRRRMEASYTVESQQYRPALLETADATHNILIDDQVASSGTAAKREEAGISGHGSAQYAIGIEPELREGSKFGNTYFDRGGSPIQEGSGIAMNPIHGDNWATAVIASQAASASRKAHQDSLYTEFLGG